MYTVTFSRTMGHGVTTVTVYMHQILKDRATISSKEHSIKTIETGNGASHIITHNFCHSYLRISNEEGKFVVG